ncbi:hypothetical protein DRN97_05590 [Methanosarcinales archaeon]|nr:MAG: hypothetical protein DRN97_05590 [Methanosarcinales archaeon]
MKREPWYLIDNNVHEMFKFRSLAALKRYAKEHDMRIKRSPIDDHCFYTESYVILPTGYLD